jgi:hypothetical protein
VFFFLLPSSDGFYDTGENSNLLHGLVVTLNLFTLTHLYSRNLFFFVWKCDGLFCVYLCGLLIPFSVSFFSFCVGVGKCAGYELGRRYSKHKAFYLDRTF